MMTTATEEAVLEYAELQEEYWEEARRGVPMSVHERYQRAFGRLRSTVGGMRHDTKLGELLVKMSAITPGQLSQALDRQLAEGGRQLLGELLVEQGIIDPSVLRLAVERQVRVTS
ncbi:MAG: hypothetical protein R6U88_04495 [Candidatus Bipolaricaulota bacterium]